MTAQIWDGGTGQTLFTYTGHTDSVNCIDWTHSGAGLIATGSQDQTVQVWSADTGGRVLTYKGHMTTGQTSTNVPLGSVHTLRWSADGQLIASASYDKTVQVWKPT
jgi:WD40 repeat protein